MTTLHDVLASWAADTPDDVLVRERHGLRRTLTVGALASSVERLAAGLVDAGVTADRPVVVWLPNRIEWFEAIGAAARAGVPIIGLNTRYRADELRHVLERANAGALVAVDEFAGIRFADILAEAGPGPLRSVLVVGDVDPRWHDAGPQVLAWSELDATTPARRDPRPDDLLIAFTTSGTTGLPKLAVHDQASTVRHAFDDLIAFDVRAGDRVLLDLPLCGTFGFSTAIASVAARATTLIDERFDPADTARAIADEGVTHYHASDDMVARVLDAGIVRSGQHHWREGGLANFTNAAARVTERVERELGVRLTGLYGMSEVFALLARWPAAMPAAARARPGGIPVAPHIEVRVVDPSTGVELAVGEEGELSFRGSPVLARYLGDPDATAAAIGADGWFRSGDLGRLTADGGFEFLARLGDSLRLRGFLVDPAEIEQRLEGHPAVELAQVVGVDRPGSGQVAVAFVRLREPVTEADLQAHCAAGIAAFKVPERIIAVDAFPTVDGPNGVKIRKRDLRERAAVIVSSGRGKMGV